MALQLGALRDALTAANVPADLASRAAEEVAGYDRQFTTLHAEIASLRSELHAEIASLRSELKGEIASLRAYVDREFASIRTEIALLRGEVRQLKWMFGVLLTTNVAILLKLFLQ